MEFHDNLIVLGIYYHWSKLQIFEYLRYLKYLSTYVDLVSSIEYTKNYVACISVWYIWGIIVFLFLSAMLIKSSISKPKGHIWGQVSGSLNQHFWKVWSSSKHHQYCWGSIFRYFYLYIGLHNTIEISSSLFLCITLCINGFHAAGFPQIVNALNNLFQFVGIINGPVHMPFNLNAFNQDINLITKNGGGCGIDN